MRPASRQAGEFKERIIGHKAAGNAIKLLECKHGAVQFELWEVFGARTEVMGRISTLAQKDRAVYKAVCSRRRQCQCLINGLNSEKVIEWLSTAADSSAEHHAALSREVRRSLGMRIRSEKK